MPNAAKSDQSGRPRTKGIKLRGLDADVDVYRDAWGIPHVRALAMADVFFAQGYVHAQDRLWQMDAARRRMLGRWAEWEGSAGVAADALARRLDIAGASQRDFAGLSREGRAMLEAYASGVNAFLEQGVPLPFEYGLVGGGRALGAMAVDPRHEAARLSDGFALVQAVARGRAAQHWTGPCGQATL